jgi:hypothetical protein
MKINVGSKDKLIRLIIAAFLFALYFTGKVSGIVSLIVLIFGITSLVTALFNFCPAYTLFGISTCKRK